MINIYAPINMLGYGIHANNMIKALSELGEDLTLTKIGQVQIDPYFESYWQAADKNIINFNAKSPSVFIFHDEFSNQACGSPLLTFSIFETDKLQELNINMLNNGPTDIVLTTTQRHKQILEENGISKPIRVVHEGVDEDIFNTIPVDKFIDTKKFTFITAGKKEKRKNTDKIIKSFLEECKEDEVALIAHTFNPFANNTKGHPFTNLYCWTSINPSNYGFEYKGFQGNKHIFSTKTCDIYFTCPGIQTSEMPCLYHSANVGIQCSSGEGWDLPLMEMMACGLPCIATRCLGHDEYLAESNLTITPTKYEIANDGIWFKGNKGNWDTIEMLEIKQKIRYAIENKEHYLEKSQSLSDEIINNFNWRKAAEELVQLTKE